MHTEIRNLLFASLMTGYRPDNMLGGLWCHTNWCALEVQSSQLMGLQRGTEIFAPLPRLVLLQKENKNLSFPRPFAIYNHPNPALHIPYNLPDTGLQKNIATQGSRSKCVTCTVSLHCSSTCLRRERGEQRQRKARLSADDHHKYHSPTATPASTSVTLCHHKCLDLQYIHLLIRLGKCHIYFRRRATE